MLCQDIDMPTPARFSAANALHEVFDRHHRISDNWNQELSPENARLAQAILGLCLRRWGRLNAWYLPKLKDPSRGLPLGTKIALSIGLAQLAWLPGVAEHAAVTESVELVSDRKLGFPPHKGMVNAILRSASRDREPLVAELDSLPTALDQSPFTNMLLQAALQYQNTPENIKILWDKLQQPPSSAFVLLYGAPPDDLVPDTQFPQAWRLPPGAPLPHEWLYSGAGMVQDISSQALMNFDWRFEKSYPARILDACAAPGGKTTALAYKYPQAHVFALEQNPHRAQKLRENLTARKVRAEIEVAESAAWLRSGGRPFDLILIDAPCSASGTLRKHPELTWIYNYSAIERLTQIQKSLLDAAIPRLSYGGLLIYSVCSWFHKEGIDHLSKIKSGDSQLIPAPVWPAAQGAELTHIFRPDPLTWEGEGFQAFAVTKKPL
jgi:16S rRNA (cytosine967-C5)-methyltransferase